MAKAKGTAVRLDALQVAVPHSDDEANEYVFVIGERQRELQRIEELMNGELAAVKARYEAAAMIPREGLADVARALQAWAEANRAKLTKDGRTKTHRLGAGEVSWRARPPRVTLRGVKEVLAALKKLRLKKFIRIKEEIDKEAMLREPDLARKVRGVTVASDGEDFVIKPFSTELEEVAP
jgi:phage host-nuclease inhibitor protein Gam